MGGRAEAGRGTRVGLRRALPPVKFFNIIKRILSPTLRAAEYYKTYYEKIHFWSNSQKEAPIPLNSPPIPPPIHSTLHTFSTPWSYPTTPPQAQSYDDIQEWSLKWCANTFTALYVTDTENLDFSHTREKSLCRCASRAKVVRSKAPLNDRRRTCETPSMERKNSLRASERYRKTRSTLRFEWWACA